MWSTASRANFLKGYTSSTFGRVKPWSLPALRSSVPRPAADVESPPALPSAAAFPMRMASLDSNTWLRQWIR